MTDTSDRLMSLWNNPETSYAMRGLQKLMHDIASDHGWRGGADANRDFAVDIALMHSELSEALEEYRANHGMNEVYYVESNGRQKPEGIPIELADLAIRLFETCWEHKIDLIDMMMLKAEYNIGRSYRHGGKRV